MTNEFDQALIDTRADFLDTFGETITYYPKAGGSREITGIVTRLQAAELDGAPYGHSPKITIHVANDATIGISSAEIDTGGDEIKCSIRIGETAANRRITKILNMDPGMMELELR